MAGYSIDLRKRVLLDSAEGLDSEEIAEKYRVSRSWVDRVKQRYRENGEIASPNFFARSPMTNVHDISPTLAIPVLRLLRNDSSLKSYGGRYSW